MHSSLCSFIRHKNAFATLRKHVYVVGGLFESLLCSVLEN
jgi:hypothetical protein